MAKFKYYENVIVNEGFYQGQKGKIIECKSFFGFFRKYRLDADHIHKFIYVKEKHLRSLDDPNGDFDKKLKNKLK